ncbi:hypothetical protein [Streptomyces sp. NPDC005859]
MAAGGSTAAALDAWIVFEDEAGFSKRLSQDFRDGVTERHSGGMVGRV